MTLTQISCCTTEPGKVAQVIEKYYTYALKSTNITTGKYLPEEALRCYPWEQSNDQKNTPDPFTQQSPLTKAELKHKSELGWLHSINLTKAPFANASNL